ncbi:hypothetical protein PsYK624_003910 [Phanerochaete sordida]|uniref:Uncharacterized protein n=1 Tax=Phanerochaete sordida TaxID=48140 RepID=A0A9P3FY12_9APHY|nr:hypothetical protein PsYK624_003910 [Phanerochaete sordida]
MITQQAALSISPLFSPSTTSKLRSSDSLQHGGLIARACMGAATFIVPYGAHERIHKLLGSPRVVSLQDLQHIDVRLTTKYEAYIARQVHDHAFPLDTLKANLHMCVVHYD